MNLAFDEIDDVIRRALHSGPEPRTPLDLAALALAIVEHQDLLAAARAQRMARFRRYTRFATAAAILLIAITATAILRHNLAIRSDVEVVQATTDDSASATNSQFSWATPLLAATLTLTAAAFGLTRAMGDDRRPLVPVPAFA